MTTSLETDRLILRIWREEDRPLFARMNADPVIMEYMPRVLPPKDSDKLVNRFERHFKKYEFGMYAVESKKTGAFMGTVGLNTVEFEAPFTPAVEIAWRLDYEYWGKGYATEAARRVLDHGFMDINLEEIVSFTVHDNTRAIHIMEKLGLKRDKNGDFHYPTLPKGHPLSSFILYRLTRKSYKALR